MRMNKLPPQEVILVWVFVKHFHFQLLTRYFMDNHLTHTHIHIHINGQIHHAQHKHTNIDTTTHDTITQRHANRITIVSTIVLGRFIIVYLFSVWFRFQRARKTNVSVTKEFS